MFTEYNPQPSKEKDIKETPHDRSEWARGWTPFPDSDFRGMSPQELAKLPLFMSPRSEKPPGRTLPPDFPREVELRELNLPLPILRCLGTAKIRKLGDVVLTPAADLMKIRYFGETSLLELRKTLRFHLCEPDERERRIVASFKEEPATGSSLSRLPLFTSNQLRTFIPSRLHETYLPELPLQRMPFSTRTAKVFNKIGIRSLGELLLIPSDVLLREKNFAEISLAETRAFAKEVILEKNPLGKTAFTSFERMFRRFIHHCLGRTPEAATLLLRMMPKGRGQPTLNEIAIVRRLSTEAVHQREKVGLRRLKDPALRTLAPFWKAVEEVLHEQGGLADLPRLAEGVRERMEWRTLPHTRPLSALLPIHPDFRLDSKEEILRHAGLSCPE